MIEPNRFRISGRERNMKNLNIANTLHSINVKKLTKPLVVCLSALFIISMISVLASTAPVQAEVTISPLHTSGHQILDSNNNPVYLRGIGRTGDCDSLSGMWSAPGQDVFNYGQKWQTDMTVLKQEMDATFTSYRDVWKVNMIRMFIPIDWWWQDNVNPAQTYGQGPNQVMSYRNYIETVIQEAAKYGIYVDICPYTVLNYYVGQNAWDGIPGSLGQASLNFMHTINADEMTAWRMWWASVANRLEQYPNAIFEMWNEPENNMQGYFTYMTNAYQAIRATGATNLIFMQYHMGIVPGYAELDWIPQFHNQLRTAISGEPTNLAYTTHPYRRAPYPNLNWATTYDGVQAQLNAPNMIPATRSNGIDVPLVFNEMGIMADQGMYGNDYFSTAQQPEASLSMDQKMQLELNFWDAILKNAHDMDIGVTAYYWMQTGVWAGSEALLSSASWPAGAASPTPSQAGQIFINDYVAPPTPTPTATPTAKPTIAPTPTPTAAPTPAPTPEPTATPASTATPSTSLIVTIEPTKTSTPTPQPTATVTAPAQPTNATSPTEPTIPATPAPTPLAPVQTQLFTFYHRHWYVIYWPQISTWFFYRG